MRRRPPGQSDGHVSCLLFCTQTDSEIFEGRPMPSAFYFLCLAGDLGLIPRLGRSPGEGKGYPLQYSGLENSMDCYSPRGHKESSRLTFTFTFLSLWCCVLWIHPLWDSLCFLELDVYFLFHVREIFSCHLFKYIFCLFFYLVLLLGSL